MRSKNCTKLIFTYVRAFVGGPLGFGIQQLSEILKYQHILYGDFLPVSEEWGTLTDGSTLKRHVELL